MQTQARFPHVDRQTGHYESFYLKACHPEGGLAVWIRYTVHKRPGGQPKGSIWFTLFDREAGGPWATKATLPMESLTAGGGAYIAIGESRFAPGRVAGSLAIDDYDVSWDLEFSGDEPPLLHLPRPWMYRAAIPRTKLLSPHPNVRFSGPIRAGGRSIDAEGWHGMVGHNWGAQHAERWIWLHGANLAPAGGGEPPQRSYLDVAIGRIKLGPATVPWIANGRLALEGQTFQLGGIERLRSTKIAERPTGCEFTLPGRGVTVRGRVGADASNFVGWVYADPDGSEHNTVNCSIADMELEVKRRAHKPITLHLEGAAAYELGMREKDHGIPIQPYPDG